MQRILQCNQADHEDGLEGKHDEGRNDLLLDDTVLVVHLENRDRDDVEVSCHRRHERAAVATGKGQGADDDGICAEGQHEGSSDADGPS